ncbi:hypothetical protein BTR14_13180 [Rhizobium rhizosphaerae]|uniref:Uncharacterized protein n=1 Tax=Xaviernesmea rhizosphaerae TaxID=1672749 RepID=A0ABX3PC63_9HYPH|nr:hypothetical protein [Xaviernesmea rhizosphaerae]OQP86030.1 hypothetical protein BTR14_13180 [Xaviernesmea rhizosphaerae]
MITVTKELIDNTYDAVTIMRLFSQRLSEGEVSEDEASEMSWLLGSAKRRLEPVIDLLEKIEHEQEQRTPAELELINEVHDLQKGWDALKAKLESRT